MWLLSIAQVLTVVATGTQPGMVTGQTDGSLPEPIPTRQTYFAIPFEIDQVDHPVLGAAEIQLYVSRDRGVTWQHETSVAPSSKHFLFRAPSDGEYWFAVRTRDRAGSFRPPLVSTPGLCVVVDTKAPSLSVEAQRGQAGQITAKWKIDEANIKADTLKLQYRTGDSQRWEDVALDPSQLQSEPGTSTGESTWWAPAGQGRVEIRAEVADAAGNRNVSHAQVTTVAAAAPQTNMVAHSRPSTVAPTTPQNDWRASSGQDSWSQQNGSSSQTGNSQGTSSYQPYSQNYGSPQGYDSGATQMANEPASQPNYGTGTNSGHSTGNSTPKYGPNRSGTRGNGYGYDSSMTAQNQTADSSAAQSSTPSQYGSQSQYDRYAQNSNSPYQGQQYNQSTQPTTPSSYDSYGEPDSNSWSNNAGARTYDRPNMGTVAAQPAPAYQSQYNPGGSAATAYDSRSDNRYGSSSGYGTSAQNRTPTTNAVRTVNTKLVEIAYDNPQQPMAVGRVEIWGTRDNGRTWKSFGFDSDSRSPILTRVPDEGTYGFNVVFHPIHGQPAQVPRPGQQPDTIIRVDLTRPTARVQSVEQSPGRSNELTIRWQASDANLADAPISLFYADASTGQWRLIEQGLQNSGQYRWSLPANLPPELQIRVDAKDVAGNATSAETHSPVRIAARTPSRQGPTSYSVEVQNTQPTGQSGQTGPRRYFIR